MKRDEFVDQYLEELESVIRRISRQDIRRVIELLYEAWKTGSQVFIAGNGGSASTATHFVCDLAKFASVEGQKRFRAISLVDNAALVSALTNDLGWENVYVEQLKNLIRQGDVFVAISVHGGSGADAAGLWSQNLLKAVKLVKENGGKVIGLSGFDGGALKEVADACIVVPVDSTPQVEGFHSVLSHLICAKLRGMMEES